MIDHVPFIKIFTPSPPRLPLDFLSATEALKRQQLARITKTALFALATICVAAVAMLFEAGIVLWPVILPAMAVAAVAGWLFSRLDQQDGHYVEGLDDTTKAALVRWALEQILHCPKALLSLEERLKRVKEINLLLGYKAISAQYVQKISDVYAHADDHESLLQAAQKQRIPMELSSRQQWVERGRFAHSSYDRQVELTWSGNAGEPVQISCCSKEIPKEG